MNRVKTQQNNNKTEYARSFFYHTIRSPWCQALSQALRICSEQTGPRPCLPQVEPDGGGGHLSGTGERYGKWQTCGLNAIGFMWGIEL